MAREIQALEVLLYGNPVGILQARGPAAQFRFFDEYIEGENRMVLGLRFEEDLRRLSTGQRRLPSWFANLLPEGQLGELVRAQTRADEPPAVVDLDLLTRLGGDLPGAATVRRIESVKPLDFDEHLSIESVAESMSVETEKDQESLLRFSIAGVGLKFSMLRDKDRFAAPASGIGGDWILKLPDGTFPHLPVNELAIMTLAGRSGIEVPEIMQVNRALVGDVPDYMWKSEEVAYAIRRFDRSASGPIHIEDMAQVRGYYPVHKYNGAFETVANYFYRGHDTKSVVEFVKRLVFSIAIGNGDAHLKNWSLIYRDRRRPTISPAYDIVSVEPYKDVVRDLGLKLAGRKSYESVRLESFAALGRRIHAEELDFPSIAREVLARMDDHWDEAEAILSQQPTLVAPIKDHFSRMKRQLLG